MLSATQIGMPGGVPMPLELLLRGSSWSGEDALTLTPRPDPVRQRRDRKKLRIASFITLTGSAGIWGPAATNSTLLAVSEINQRGGILGREVEVVFHDAGGLMEDVVRAASDVVASDDADIIMGTHISAVRVALRKIVGGRIPYVYTSVYEGGERTPGVMAIGEIAHIARIRAAKPDVVFISLIGADSIAFNRAFAKQGLASKMFRLGGAIDETVLLGIGADNTENLYCSAGYFADLATRENEALRGQYEALFGRYAPPLGSMGQSNYEGLRFIDTVASRAGSLAIKPLLSIAMNVDYDGARGRVGIRRGAASMPIYLAEADGLDFRLIKKF